MTIRPVGARWATFAIFFVNGFIFGVWAASIPPLKMLLGLTPAALSYALLAGAVGAVTMMQFAGTLVARLGGTGRTTKLAALFYLPICALPTLATTLPVLALCLAALGAVNGLMDVSMNAHAAAVEKQWGAPIMSSFHAGFSIGGLIGNGFGALMIACGVPTPFLMPAVGIVSTVILLVAVRHLGPGEVPRASHGFTETIKRSNSLFCRASHPKTGDHFSVKRSKRHQGGGFQLPDRTLLAPGLICACCFLVEGAMADWGGVYLTAIGVSAAAATAGFGAFSLTMVSGRLLGDRLVRALGRPAVVRYGALTAAIGLALAVIVPTMVAIVAGFALVGAGLANVVPSVFSTAANLGKTPASGIAAVSTAGYGGMLAGPPLIGAVASAWGLRTGVAVMAAMAIMAVAFSFVPNRTRT